MARKKLTFPRKGKIKKTGQVVTLHRETVIAGIPCYLVSSAGRNARDHYARSAVTVLAEDRID